jgi:hypothetical protein
MDRSIMEEQVPTITPEELMAMYDQRIQDQTGIIFALVGKLGGKVTLSQEDLLAYPEFNTVAAEADEAEGLVLELKYEER